MPACVVAVALLCLPWTDGVTFRTDESSFGAGASVRTVDGEVDFFYWSDDVFAAGWDTAARVCRGDRCVEYRREDRDAQTTIFMIRGADCDLGRRIEVRGVSPAGRAALLQTFAVIPPHGERSEAVALADLSERRPLALPHEARQLGPPAPNLTCTD